MLSDNHYSRCEPDEGLRDSFDECFAIKNEPRLVSSHPTRCAASKYEGFDLIHLDYVEYSRMTRIRFRYACE